MSETISLSPEHTEILSWFEEHQLKVLDQWPEPIGENNDLFIVNRAKGIQKPAGLEHSTSLRVAFGEKYGDGPDIFSDDTWRLFYHLEDHPDLLEHWTNRGVLRCMEDGIPIGVIQQISNKPNRYRVFGLGLVTNQEGEYFTVEGPVSLNGLQAPTQSDSDVDLEKILKDARDKTLMEVYRRRGQGKFRSNLLKAYDERCAVTGCAIVAILEAAHILPHRGSASDFVQNGILLRSDIHTLFDLGLLQIDPETYECSLADAVRKDPQYATIHGSMIRLPNDRSESPDPKCLRELSVLLADK